MSRETRKQKNALKIVSDFVEEYFDEFGEYLEEFWDIESSEAEVILDELKSIELIDSEEQS